MSLLWRLCLAYAIVLPWNRLGQGLLPLKDLLDCFEIRISPLFLCLLARLNILVLVVYLPIVDPVTFVLDFTIVKQFTVSMPEIVLEVANINHAIVIVYLSISTFLVVLVFSSILNTCLSLLKISFSVT
jgi:hypothetical protein